MPIARRSPSRPRVAALALVVLLAGGPAGRAAAASAPPQPQARAWILVDASDRETLAAHGAHQPRAIASTTKLMTAYLALRELDPDERVTAPRYDPLPGESLLGLRTGERIAVSDLLYGLLMASGNDAAVALATAAAGSVPAFVAGMNTTAARLGLDQTSYANPIGLDDPGNYSSAADLARLTLLLRREPLFRRIVDTAETTLGGGPRSRQLENRNTLVARFPWVSGVKTGYTAEAGYVLVGSAVRRGVTLVSVVLGAPSEAARDEGTLALLRHGFSLYERRTVIRDGERLAAAEVRYQDERLEVAAARDVTLTVRRGQTVEVTVEAPGEVEGPVERGARLGNAIVTVDGEPAGTVRLVATRRVPEAGLLDRADSALPGPRWVAIAAPLAAAAGILIGIAAALGRRRHAG